MSDLVDVIEEDMALSARILRIANSAYYGVPRKIDNLKLALVILGMDEIANMVMTISVLRIFPASRNEDIFDISSFWRHSAATAEITMGLYEGLRLPRPSSAYAAGLLHDVGKLILDQYFRKYFIACMKKAVKDDIMLAKAELQVLGVDHGHIGSWLTQRWNLPEEICKAIAQHHLRPASSDAFSLAGVIDWADRLFYLMEDTPASVVAKILNADPDWQEWQDGRVKNTDYFVNILFERVNRSLRLIQIIR